MMSVTTTRSAIAAAALCALAGTAVAQITGPSTTTAPYLLPSAPGVSTTSILTAGDTINGYRLVGIPDGMGMFSNDNGSFTLLVNHELGATSGITRAHGSAGAFVSRWEINSNATNLTVNNGRDHNTSANDVNTWNGTSYVQGTTAFNRFCSGDLAAPSAYTYTDPSGAVLGTNSRIYMNGEEAGAEGRAFAHIVTGPATNQTYQLPALGRFSWENSVANPVSQQLTIVAGTDDTSTNGGVYFYVGNKTNTGNDIERAGLTNGNLYGVRVAGTPNESRNGAPAANTRFDLFNHGDVRNTSGADLNSSGVANGVTGFLRPEDGAWDSRAGRQNDFYFVTTDRFNSASQVGRSRLWRMRFDDITNPTAGGTLTALLNGTEGGNMFDNICIDSHGRIIIQEDIGNQSPLGKIWLYDIDSGGFGAIASHDPNVFLSGALGFLTQDEESSGVIDAKDILGDGWFLINDQAHYSIAGELVEGGQLLAIYVDPTVIPGPSAAALLGLAGLAASRRRRA